MKKTTYLTTLLLFFAGVFTASAQMLPPVNFTAENTNGDVTLNWGEAGSGAWLRYDNGENNDGIGLTSGGTAIFGIKYDPAELTGYNGMFLTKISFFPRGTSSTFIMKIYQDETVAVEQAMDNLTFDQWNEVELTTPLTIDATKTLYIAYEVTMPQGEYPAGNDEGPAVVGKGDLLYDAASSSWKSLKELTGGQIDCNWNLAGWVAKTAGDKAMPMMAAAPQNDLTAVTAANLSVGNLPAVKSAKAELEGYNVYRNGAKVNAATITETTYTETVEPGMYTYFVKAVYDEGESAATQSITLSYLINMVDRNMVVVEIGTGTWCQYCPGAALGADDLVANDHNVAVIEYHGGDNYATTDGSARLDFYGIASYPTAMFDGTTEVGGGSHTQSMYPNYKPVAEACAATQSPITMTFEGFKVDNDGTYKAVVKTEEVGTNVHGDLKFHLIITESEISESWQGQSKLDFVQRACVYGAQGTDADYSSESTQNFEKEFNIAPSWNAEHCEVVAFIQSAETKQILQAMKMEIKDFAPVGLNENNMVATQVYPNPATENVTVKAEAEINRVMITNIAGQVVYTAAVNAAQTTINTNNLNSGLYFVTIETAQGNSIVKMQVK